jgi:threonine/homoserine/homoserine lactone efflux protein
MEVLLSFLLAFFFSFIGTIPPGSINLTMLQLGLEHKMNIAWRFAITVSIIEYPYAWIAIKFEKLITSSPVVTENFQLLAGIVMLTLGIINLWSSQNTGKIIGKFHESGFRRGLILALLNPLAIPFWVGVTAYILSLKMIRLETNASLHAYLLGVSTGTLSLLIVLAYLAKKLVKHFQRQDAILKKIPGFTMILLGIYSLANFFL